MGRIDLNELLQRCVIGLECRSVGGVETREGSLCSATEHEQHLDSLVLECCELVPEGVEGGVFEGVVVECDLAGDGVDVDGGNDEVCYAAGGCFEQWEEGDVCFAVDVVGLVVENDARVLAATGAGDGGDHGRHSAGEELWLCVGAGGRGGEEAAEMACVVDEELAETLVEAVGLRAGCGQATEETEHGVGDGLGGGGAGEREWEGEGASAHARAVIARHRYWLGHVCVYVHAYTRTPF